MYVYVHVYGVSSMTFTVEIQMNVQLNVPDVLLKPMLILGVFENTKFCVCMLVHPLYTLATFLRI